MRDLKNLGSEFFPEMDAVEFMDLLGLIAYEGEEEAACTLGMEETEEFPADFLKLHRGKLQIKPFFLWTDVPCDQGIGVLMNLDLGFCVPVFYGTAGNGFIAGSGSDIREPYTEKKMAKACLKLLAETLEWCPIDFPIVNCCPKHITRNEVAEILKKELGMNDSDFLGNYSERK